MGSWCLMTAPYRPTVDKSSELRPVSGGVGKTHVDELARRLAKEAPELADLSASQLEAVARQVLGRRLVRDLDRKTDLAGIDYEAEKATFLAQVSRTKSLHTRKAYAHSLARLEAFIVRQKLEVLALSPREADDFAYELQAEGRVPASVRLDLAAVSSFYTWLERRHASLRNPLRGTKARPEKQRSPEAAYPSEEEAQKILEELAPAVRTAAVLMLYRGLRVGALPSLTVRAGRFTALSKGKEISGTMPTEALEAIRAAGLESRQPFAAWSATRLADGFRRKTRKLYAEGKLIAAYSAHDLRHLYTIREYRKDHDIYRVSKLLGHASIQVTENYLRGLGEVD
jgi:site-specific recombinase XerD